MTISPLPGSRDASPQTQISFLGVPAGELSAVSVVGSRTGAHTGRMAAYRAEIGGTTTGPSPTAGGGGQPAAPAPVELFVALDGPPAELRRAAFRLLIDARSAGLSAQMDLGGRSLKGQLGHAGALGARYVAIVGDGQTVLKDMQGGGQSPIATDAVVHAVLRSHHAL